MANVTFVIKMMVTQYIEEQNTDNKFGHLISSE